MQGIRLPLLAGFFLFTCLFLTSTASRILNGDGISARAALPDLYEASIAELQDGLEKGLFTSVDLVKAYFARIEEVNLQGPALHAVLEMNPDALSQAAALDAERKATGPRGPLHGIPILLKDNIGTHDGMNTTAGSFALLGSVPPRDATVAAKLRAAGAIILGKANMSEWAHFRGPGVAEGFSGRGGQATSPYFPLADPSGSSSGSSIGTAIGLAAAALGTETDGSIVLPSSRNNLVGIKPTVGLTSRAGAIPVSVHQDTIGPLTRSIADGAAILTVIAGQDPLDNYTWAQPPHVPNFLDALKPNGLKGVRLGVPRLFQGNDTNVIAAFNASIELIRSLGATVVDPAEFPNAEEMLASLENELVVLETNFKAEIQNYISELLRVPTGIKNLADIIAFNTAHPDEELIPPYYTDQSYLIASENTTVNAAYYAALNADTAAGQSLGIDATLKKYNLDAILLPADGFTSTPAAIAGYPVVTVPLGFQPDNVIATPADPVVETAPGLPFGISFMGTAFSDFDLITYAFAYEQATHTRLKRLAFPAAIPKTQLKDVIGK